MNIKLTDTAGKPKHKTLLDIMHICIKGSVPKNVLLIACSNSAFVLLHFVLSNILMKVVKLPAKETHSFSGFQKSLRVAHFSINVVSLNQSLFWILTELNISGRRRGEFCRSSARCQRTHSHTKLCSFHMLRKGKCIADHSPKLLKNPQP